MKLLAKKLIRKYSKELKIEGWDIDIEFAFGINTQLCINNKAKTALIAVNSNECKSQRDLDIIIKNLITKLSDENT